MSGPVISRRSSVGHRASCARELADSPRLGIPADDPQSPSLDDNRIKRTARRIADQLARLRKPVTVTFLAHLLDGLGLKYLRAMVLAYDEGGAKLVDGDGAPFADWFTLMERARTPYVEGAANPYISGRPADSCEALPDETDLVSLRERGNLQTLPFPRPIKAVR